MKYPMRYADLAPSEAKTAPPYLSFHSTVNQKDSKQFFVGSGEQRLAVKSASPYGVRTLEDIAQSSMSLDSNSDLLDIDHIGQDYTVYEVPEDMLSIVAVTLGSGPQRNADLDGLFEHIGRTVALKTDEYSMRNLGISGLGFLRDAGQVTFIPPYNFQYGVADKNEVANNLSESIRSSLKHTFLDSRIKQLTHLTLKGLEYSHESAR